MKKPTVSFLTKSAVIAALYVVLTLLSSLVGLSGGVIQLRLSEALCVLPLFTPAAVPGLFIGCVLANILTGGVLWDVVFGSLATLLGALGAYLLRNKKPALASLPTVFSNTLIVPFVLRYAYGAEGSLLFFAFTVFLGEFITAWLLGNLLAQTLRRHKIEL